MTLREIMCKTINDNGSLDAEVNEIISSIVTKKLESEVVTDEMVLDYLQKSNMTVSQKSMEQAKAYLQSKATDGTGEVAVRTDKKLISHLDEFSDEELKTLIDICILKGIQNLSSPKIQYEYDVDVVLDSSGRTDIYELSEKLNLRAQNHWRVKHIFTNELGKNAVGVGVSGIGVGTNSTVDEIVIVYERVKKDI